MEKRANCWPEASCNTNCPSISLTIRADSSTLKKRSSWPPCGSAMHKRPVAAKRPTCNVPWLTTARPAKPLQPPVPEICSADDHRRRGSGSANAVTPSIWLATHSLPTSTAPEAGSSLNEGVGTAQADNTSASNANPGQRQKVNKAIQIQGNEGAPILITPTIAAQSPTFRLR